MFITMLCGTVSSVADVVRLKTGKTITGIIVSQDNQAIQFRSDVGIILLRRDTIESIEKETPEINYIRTGDMYAERGEYDKATTQYLLALQLNPNAAEANNKLNAITSKLDQIKTEQLSPYFVDGDRMVKQGRFKEAIAFYQDVYTKNPTSDIIEVARKRLALTYFELANNDLDRISKYEAINDFLKSIGLDSTNPEVYFALGSVYLSMANQEQNAVQQFTFCLKLNPREQNAFFQRAEAYYRLGQYTAAVADYQQMLNTHLDSTTKQLVTKQIASSYWHLGKLAIDQNSVDTAISYFQQSLVSRPDYGMAYYELGGIQYKRGKYTEAATLLEKAVELEPLRAEIFKLLGDTNIALKRFAEAIKRYQRAIELAPKDPVIITALADAYRYRGMYSDAIRNYLLALDVEPNFYPTHFGLGISYENTEQYEQALQHYRRATEIRPEDYQAHLVLGTMLYRRMKQYDAARKELQMVISMNSQNSEAHFVIGQINTAEGYYSNAIGDFQDATKYKPDYAEAYSEMGKAYRYKKNYEFALEAYSKATVLNPNLAEPYQGLGILYHQVYSDYAKALQNYEQFLKVGGKDPQVLTWIEEVKLAMKEKK